MLQLDNIMNQTFLAMISDTWQMLTIITAALGVGYVTARKLSLIHI